MDDTVREYIDRVLRLQAQRQAVTLDQADLEDIAREVGLSDEDLAAVRAEVGEYRKRAAGYLRHGLVDEAIGELDEAVSLAPTNPDVLMELALALMRQWEAGETDAGERARRLALRVLDADPDQDAAFEIMAQIREGRHTGGFDPQPQFGSLPITVVEPTYGLVPLPWRISHSVYDSGAYFSYEGWFRNLGNEELVELSAAITVIGDGHQDDLGEQYVLTASPPIRPGDTFYWSVTTKGPQWTVERAELRLTNVETRPAAQKYPRAPAVALGWDIEAPAGLEFSVAERSRQQSYGRLRVALEVQNRSDRAVDELQFMVRALSDAGAELAADMTRIATPGFPPFMPGERRIVGAWVEVEEPAASYSLAVCAIR